MALILGFSNKERGNLSQPTVHAFFLKGERSSTRDFITEVKTLPRSKMINAGV
jgi:hypothetical protein